MADFLAVLSGLLVGFSLGLVGGGGSILATPLLLYVVGLPKPHLAIGTSALAVSVNAFVNFAGHARAGTVRWRNAVLFAATGVVGALLGSSLGKAFDGERLLFLFALLMIVVGALMLRPPKAAPAGPPASGWRTDLKVAPIAFLVGLLSGFFGIGGGFLIVPGLVLATGMPILNAIGSSLFAVGSFGLATALNYALSGLIAWTVAAEFVLGGVLGGWLGMRLSIRLAPRRNLLNRLFAGLIFAVAAYMLWHTVDAL